MINADSGKDHSIRRVITLKEVHEDGPVDGRVDVRLWTHFWEAQRVVGEGRGVNGLHHERFLVRTKLCVFKLKSKKEKKLQIFFKYIRREEKDT
jgi:hypothetical protein